MDGWRKGLELEDKWRWVGRMGTYEGICGKRVKIKVHFIGNIKTI